MVRAGVNETTCREKQAVAQCGFQLCFYRNGESADTWEEDPTYGWKDDVNVSSRRFS